jgi:hypothetical protein
LPLILSDQAQVQGPNRFGASSNGWQHLPSFDTRPSWKARPQNRRNAPFRHSANQLYRKTIRIALDLGLVNKTANTAHCYSRSRRLGGMQYEIAGSQYDMRRGNHTNKALRHDFVSSGVFWIRRHATGLRPMHTYLTYDVSGLCLSPTAGSCF